MTNNTLISIVIPAYKNIYLAECIDSILSQNYNNWELVVINDNSPYDIDSIINKYSDTRIIYKKRSSGFGSEKLVDNWNDCLKYVSGAYVINMGDDDILLPGCLEEYIRMIKKYPSLNIIHGWTEIINDRTEIIDVNSQHPEFESVYGFMLRIWKGENLFIGNILIKTSFLRLNDGYKYYPHAWGSDHITAYMAASYKGIASTSKIVFGYRKHNKTISMSKSNLSAKLEADLQVFDWYRDFLKYYDPNTNDKVTYNCLISMLPNIKSRKISQDISEGCKHAPWKVLSYIHFLQKNNFSIKVALKSIISSIS